jgi:hypothetical protein
VPLKHASKRMQLKNSDLLLKIMHLQTVISNCKQKSIFVLEYNDDIICSSEYLNAVLHHQWWNILDLHNITDTSHNVVTRELKNFGATCTYIQTLTSEHVEFRDKQLKTNSIFIVIIDQAIHLSHFWPFDLTGTHLRTNTQPTNQWTTKLYYQPYNPIRTHFTARSIPLMTEC